MTDGYEIYEVAVQTMEDLGFERVPSMGVSYDGSEQITFLLPEDPGEVTIGWAPDEGAYGLIDGQPYYLLSTREAEECCIDLARGL